MACHLLGPGSVMCAVWGRRMAARASNEPGPRGGGREGPNRHGSWGGQALPAVGASGAPQRGWPCWVGLLGSPVTAAWDRGGPAAPGHAG